MAWLPQAGQGHQRAGWPSHALVHCLQHEQVNPQTACTGSENPTMWVLWMCCIVAGFEGSETAPWTITLPKTGHRVCCLNISQWLRGPEEATNSNDRCKMMQSSTATQSTMNTACVATWQLQSFIHSPGSTHDCSSCTSQMTYFRQFHGNWTAAGTKMRGQRCTCSDRSLRRA